MNADPRYQKGWEMGRTFLNVKIVGLHARFVKEPSLSIRIDAFEKARRYSIYTSSRKPPGEDIVWIDQYTNPVSLRFRSSTTLRLLLQSEGEVLGETHPIQVMKEMITSDRRPIADYLDYNYTFGPYKISQGTGSKTRSFGTCDITLQFDCSGKYAEGTEHLDELCHFELIHVGHEKVLRWFIEVMTAMFDPLPLSVQLTWLTLSRIWDYHKSTQPDSFARGSVAEDILCQMKVLLFALRNAPNLHTLRAGADNHATVLGNLPGTIGDLSRLVRLPHDVRERFGADARYVTYGLHNDLVQEIVTELCLGAVMLEEFMCDYHLTYGNISSTLQKQAWERQRGLYTAHFRAIMFLTQNCTVPILLNVEKVVETLLYYIHGETALPDHLRHYTNALTSGRGYVGDEIQAVLHPAIMTVKTTAARKKLRRVLTSLVQRSNRTPKFLLLTDVEAGKGIGGGGFADVFAGKWKKSAIAIKSLKSIKAMPSDPESRAKLFLEVITWKTLKHPRIIELYGVAKLPTISEICMISPFMDRGTVRERFYLDTTKRGKSLPAGEDLRRRIIMETAEGMAYLHSEGVIHGDLRADNLFLDSEDHVKIADFGLCVFSDGFSRNYFSMRSGNARWAAPELVDSQVQDNTAQDGLLPGMIRTHRPKEPCDVFSFACVCIELYSRAAPYSHLSNETTVIHFLTSRVNGVQGRPARPQELISNDLWFLMQRCWREAPAERPCFTEVVDELLRAFPQE